MSSKKSISERIEIQREKARQETNKLKQLENQEKFAKRKERDRRIYRRGAHLESLLSGTIILSDARFYTFLEKTVANQFGRKILNELVAEQEKDDTKKGAAEPIQKTTELPAIPKTTAADVSGDTDEDEETGIV